MNYVIKLIIAIPLLVAVSGCAKEPPKCSDESTFSLIRQIIVGQIGGREGVTDKELEENMKIELPRASAFDEKVKKFSCEAKLVAGGAVEMPITYESQLDDSDQHIVSVGGISPGDLMTLQYAISTGIKKGRAGQANNESPQTQNESPVQQSSLDISGVWKGSLEGDGEMEIAPVSGGYSLKLNVSDSSGCSGSIEGSATLANGSLTLTKNDDSELCTVTINFSGDKAEINENNCSYYHGAACSFYGTLVKQSN